MDKGISPKRANLCHNLIEKEPVLLDREWDHRDGEGPVKRGNLLLFLTEKGKL